MRNALRLFLILCLMLTGIGLGAARGTVQIGGQVVLCTGEGVVLRDIPGQGNGRLHICPDMALSLLGATTPTEAPVLLGAPFRRWHPPILRAAAVSRSEQTACARDPPERPVLSSS